MAALQRAGIPRRKFVYLATATFATAGAGAALWPFIDQMNPPRHTRPDDIEVDLSSIGEGQTSNIRWRYHQPVYIRHRTQNDIAAARRVPLSELRDRDAR
jgi:ubiquinol-cytochrome c reductase iron-sulfur subunit